MTTQTVAEHLAETRASGAMTEEGFRAYAGSDVSNYSSWAIWGKTTSDLSVFDVVLVSHSVDKAVVEQMRQAGVKLELV